MTTWSWTAINIGCFLWFCCVLINTYIEERIQKWQTTPISIYIAYYLDPSEIFTNACNNLKNLWRWRNGSVLLAILESVPSTRTMAHKHPWLQSRKIWCPFWPWRAPGTCVVHIHIYRQSTYKINIHIKSKINKSKNINNDVEKESLAFYLFNNFVFCGYNFSTWE